MRYLVDTDVEISRTAGLGRDANGAPDTSDWSPQALYRARMADSRARHWSGQLIERLYKIRRARGLCRRLCGRLEGGLMLSQTWRQIMRSHYKVEIGRYSYGAILIPNTLPPGSRVGAYCSIGSQLIVRRRNHPVERPALHPFFYNSKLGLLARDNIEHVTDNPLHVGNDVWIGDRVTVLSGCRSIGNGAIIGAGAVVTRDVPPYSVVGGIPARLMRMRFEPDQIATIEATQWWKRSISDLAADRELMDILAGNMRLSP